MANSKLAVVSDVLDANRALESGQAWKEQCARWDELIKTGLLPSHVRTSAQAIAIVLTGNDLGLTPMRSIRGLHVINGKVEMSAELIHAMLIERCPDATLEFLESSSKRCCIRARRHPNDVPIEVEFTIEDAQRAGLVRKDSNWTKYPQDMLVARCISRLRRRKFPDVGFGSHVPGELNGVAIRQLEPKADILDDLIEEIGDDPREIPIPVEHEPIEEDENLAELLRESLDPCPACEMRGGHHLGCPESHE
jgi:hypothetical protein